MKQNILNLKRLMSSQSNGDPNTHLNKLIIYMVKLKGTRHGILIITVSLTTLMELIKTFK